MKKLVLFVLVSGFALCAAGLTGKWSGTAEIENAEGGRRREPVFLNLTQDGSGVTGAVGEREGDTVAIRNGKLAGQELTFEAVTQDGESWKFNLVFDGSTITGEAGNERIAAKLNLKRAD